MAAPTIAVAFAPAATEVDDGKQKDEICADRPVANFLPLIRLEWLIRRIDLTAPTLRDEVLPLCERNLADVLIGFSAADPKLRSPFVRFAL